MGLHVVQEIIKSLHPHTTKIGSRVVSLETDLVVSRLALSLSFMIYFTPLRRPPQFELGIWH